MARIALRTNAKNLERRSIRHIDLRSSIHINSVAGTGCPAIKLKGQLRSICDIQCAAQGQHQPRRRTIRRPLYRNAGTVKGQNAAGVIEAKAHPTFAVAGKLAVNGDFTISGKGQRLIKTFGQFAVLKQGDR